MHTRMRIMGIVGVAAVASMGTAAALVVALGWWVALALAAIVLLAYFVIARPRLPGHHDQRRAGADLAMAGPDRVRTRRLVQLRLGRQR